MSVTLDDIAKSARDGITTSVGLGLLVFQQAQVQRRQLTRVAEQTVRTLGTALDEHRRLVEQQLSTLTQRDDKNN
jgi:hypothetical protein